MTRYFDRYQIAKVAFGKSEAETLRDIMVLFWDDISYEYHANKWGNDLTYVRKWHYDQWEQLLQLCYLQDSKLEELLTKEYRGGVAIRALPFALKRFYSWLKNRGK